jgi:hypothetical protein
MEEVLIAVAFLSTQSPYILPPGEEMEARAAHHRFRDAQGDFLSYLKLFNSYKEAKVKSQFCEKNYLDERSMAEISNVVFQLGEIVSDMNIPLLSGGDKEDYLCACARGLIQFVCVRVGRDMYRSLTADKIIIHPGSVMFKTDPKYIVAGEIVKTTRMYAMSVSPLSKDNLDKIRDDLHTDLEGSAETLSTKELRDRKHKDNENELRLGYEIFPINLIKGKKIVLLPWEQLSKVKGILAEEKEAYRGQLSKLRGTIIFESHYRLLEGEKLSFILSLTPSLSLDGVLDKNWSRKKNFHVSQLEELLSCLPMTVSPGLWKKGKKDLGFISLVTDGVGNYWFNCSRGFHASLNESLYSVETLISEIGETDKPEVKQIVNQTYRRLSSYIL